MTVQISIKEVNIIVVVFQSVSFDPKIRTHIDSMTGCEVPYTPQGRFIHIPPPCPSASWANDFGTPWWKGNALFVILLH